MFLFNESFFFGRLSVNFFMKKGVEMFIVHRIIFRFPNIGITLVLHACN